MKENVFVDGERALVGKAQCGDELGTDVNRAVEAIGGWGRLVEAGDTILVKPNFNTGDPPPGSSDPLFVRAVIEQLYAHGAGKVVLGESSMFRLSTRETLRQTGMLQAAQEAGAEVVCFDEGQWEQVETGGRYLKRVRLAQAGLDAQKIVYVCCLKTHRLANFTMSLKLTMGFVTGKDRLNMHMRKLKQKLAELNLVIQPDLVIIDGRRCFISGGPDKGELREPNLVLASGDQVAIDVEGIRVIQGYPGNSLSKEPWELPMIRHAVELGLGASSEAAYRVVDGGS